MTIEIIDGEWWNPETKDLECFRGIILEELRKLLEWISYPSPQELDTQNLSFEEGYEYAINQLLAELEDGVGSSLSCSERKPTGSTPSKEE